MCVYDADRVLLLREFETLRDKQMGREESGEENEAEQFNTILDIRFDHSSALDCHGVCDVEHDGCET